MPPEVTEAVSSGATADPLQGLKVPPFKFAKTKDAGMLCPAPSVNAAVGVLNQSATSTLVRVLVNDQLVVTVSAPVVGFGAPVKTSEGGTPVIVICSPTTYDNWTDETADTIACAFESVGPNKSSNDIRITENILSRFISVFLHFSRCQSCRQSRYLGNRGNFFGAACKVLRINSRC